MILSKKSFLKNSQMLCYILNNSSLQGGGTGGSIRDAGGSFGKMEAAHEEEYFRRLVTIFNSKKQYLS